VKGIETGVQGLSRRVQLHKSLETLALNISREILDTSKEVLGEVKGLRKDLHTMLDERLAKIEKDIAAIKAKIGLL
jgi:hypothetical protein